jgi:hypothetical protein
MRGDISPHELPLDNPAHAEAQRREDVEAQRLRERRESGEPTGGG